MKTLHFCKIPTLFTTLCISLSAQGSQQAAFPHCNAPHPFAIPDDTDDCDNQPNEIFSLVDTKKQRIKYLITQMKFQYEHIEKNLKVPDSESKNQTLAGIFYDIGRNYQELFELGIKFSQSKCPELSSNETKTPCQCDWRTMSWLDNYHWREETCNALFDDCSKDCTAFGSIFTLGLYPAVSYIASIAAWATQGFCLISCLPFRHSCTLPKNHIAYTCNQSEWEYFAAKVKVDVDFLALETNR